MRSQRACSSFSYAVLLGMEYLMLVGGLLLTPLIVPILFRLRGPNRSISICGSRSSSNDISENTHSNKLTSRVKASDGLLVNVAVTFFILCCCGKICFATHENLEDVMLHVKMKSIFGTRTRYHLTFIPFNRKLKRNVDAIVVDTRQKSCFYLQDLTWS